jgi:hypothetical protein
LSVGKYDGFGCGDISGDCGNIVCVTMVYGGGGGGVASAKVFVCCLETSLEKGPFLVGCCHLPPFAACEVEVPTFFNDVVVPAETCGLGVGVETGRCECYSILNLDVEHINFGWWVPLLVHPNGVLLQLLLGDDAISAMELWCQDMEVHYEWVNTQNN